MARPAPVLDRAAGALALAALPLHGWMLAAHAHGPLLTGILLGMLAACTLCAVHVLRAGSGERPLWRLQLMALAMVLTHAVMAAGLPGVGMVHHHGGAGGTGTEAAGTGGAMGVDGPLVAVMALELAVGLAASLALAARRRGP